MQPNLQTIIEGIPNDTAKNELLNLLNLLCDEVDEAREQEHLARDDVRVFYRNRLGFFQSPPLWASDVEANWELLRQMVHTDTGADIGRWAGRKVVENAHRQYDPSFYQKEGHDADHFA